MALKVDSPSAAVQPKKLKRTKGGIPAAWSLDLTWPKPTQKVTSFHTPKVESPAALRYPKRTKVAPAAWSLGYWGPEQCGHPACFENTPIKVDNLAAEEKPQVYSVMRYKKNSSAAVRARGGKQLIAITSRLLAQTCLLDIGAQAVTRLLAGESVQDVKQWSHSQRDHCVANLPSE